MPKLRSRHRSQGVASVLSDYTGRRKGVSSNDRKPPITECAGSSQCTEAMVPDCPVPLCGKHLREAYQLAQGLIEDRLLIAAASSME